MDTINSETDLRNAILELERKQADEGKATGVRRIDGSLRQISGVHVSTVVRTSRFE